MDFILKILEWPTSNPVFVVFILFLILKYDLREAKKERKNLEKVLEAKLEPINNQLNNHIPSAIKHLTERIDRLYEAPPKKKEL